ncbi:MAG: hypothetical protein A2X06_07470 [Bacteroidetes bacterium GWC2_40_22]|nr:MAG: hypothetical protein A2X06_07470 [Bacteroidetes bacterium GWC2_40_22]
MDFTLKTYKLLLHALRNQGFSFLIFEESLSGQQTRSIVLRHDVDLLPLNSLEFARIQAEAGISGSYYFRLVPESYNENIIKEIASLGHEVGYHYEDVSLAAERQKTKVERQKFRISNLFGLQDRTTAGLQDNGRGVPGLREEETKRRSD